MEPIAEQRRTFRIDRDERVMLVASRHRLPLDGGATCLFRFRQPRAATRGPVLLVHGFAQNHHAWHLSRRSFAAFLARLGFDVFAIDLRGVGCALELGAPRPAAFAEYVEEDLRRAVARIRSMTADRPVWLVGHSMGGALCCALAGLMPESVRGLVTFAGLYDFGRDRPGIWALTRLVVALRPVLAGLHRRIPIPTQAVGSLLRWSRLAFDSRAARWLPLQAWAPGSIEAPLLHEALRSSFSPTTTGIATALSALAHGGGFVDPGGVSYFDRFEQLDLPLLVIAGSADQLISPRDSAACFHRSASTDKQFALFSAAGSGGPAMGHVDLILGRHARQTTWSLVEEWLTRRSQLAPLDQWVPASRAS